VTSIRHRLLVLLLGLWATLWLAVAVITLERSGHEIEELLDAQLAQTANVLRQITLAGNLPDLARQDQALSPLGHPYENKISFQLWRRGELVSTFGGAPRGPLAEAPGFSDQEIGQTLWRVYGLPTGRPDEALFVAQSYSIRQELIQFLTIHALQPILWSLPLTVLIIWFAVADGLKPLHRLAAAIAKRSADRLAPIDEAVAPIETRPLTSAVNGLLEQLERALSAERRFAADASHELRTPLTAIRTHAQIAQRSRDPNERAEALARLVEGVDRAAHLVTQLLTLARLEPEAAQTAHPAASLSDAVLQVARDKRTLADAKSIDLALGLPDGEPSVVAVPYAALEVLVANLLDNAIKYSLAGSRVDVTLAARGSRHVLRIGDHGHGIPASERQRVLGRFVRREGHAEAGAGLGLSIVRRICELYGAELALLDGDDGVGLLVEVVLPSPSPPLL
jgi:signal transduction histidine kinase